MIDITGYQAFAKIKETGSTIEYHAQRVSDERSVIIKVPKSDSAGAELQNAYDIAHNLKIPGIIEHIRLEKCRNSIALILEDYEELKWKTLISNNAEECKNRPNYPTFFLIAIQVIDTLGELHRNNIIHKSIKPDNIKVVPETGRIKITGFEMAAIQTEAFSHTQQPRLAQMDAAYFSPEQTGRMNRSVDIRTDFYSLGITFFQMLTGELPFKSDDTMEIIHKHLAQRPVPPDKLNPEIHKPISDIILKLLSKNPEDRYQTIHGLKTDLLECQFQYQANQTIEAFEIAKQDITDKFRIPEKLYGRENEIVTLISAFESVATPEQAKSQMLLVTGHPGIGKSVLVHEVHKPIVRLHGYFCTGKFDQFKRDIPYSAIIQAFNELVRQLLIESETKLKTWRKQFLEALGPNAQVVIEVIPALERIIGSQPPAFRVSATEANNRFHFVFLNFLRVFAQPAHPLVVFLDDLQWADLATLKLLRALMTDPEIKHFLLIGAYRDNEVDPVHPLTQTLDEIKKAGTPVNHVNLGYLAQSDVNQLIVDTFHTENFSFEGGQGDERTKPLTEFVYNKTKGNPFFVKQFLITLYDEKLLTFVPPVTSHWPLLEGESTEDPRKNLNYKIPNSKLQIPRWGWQWDLSQFAARDITDDIVEFMTEKIRKMSDETQNILKLASCIGNRFELKILATIIEKQSLATADDLEEAIEEGLIVPLISISDSLNPRYRFIHDRIQQAAYSLIAEKDKPAIHLKNARLLLRNVGEEEKEEKIFDLVNNFNMGRDLVTRLKEQTELAQLNLQAGRKAKDSAAFEAALNYFKIGLGLLSEDSWQTDYAMTLALHEEGAETAYLSGDYEDTEHLVEVVLKQAKTVLDCAKIYEIRIEAFTSQQKMPEAVETGLEMLRKLGIKLPFKPKKATLVFELARTKLTLLGKNVANLENLPEMTDSRKLAIMRILVSITPATFMVAPELFPMMAFNMVRLSVKYGNSNFSCFAYANYGIILCGIIGDVNSGYRFGDLALSLRERFNANELTARLFLVSGIFIRHRREHIRELFAQFLKGYQTGLETGDLIHAAFCIFQYCSHMFFAGLELKFVETEMAKHAAATRKIKQEMQLNIINLNRQLVSILRGNTKDKTRLQRETLDEEKMLPIFIQANDKTSLVWLYLYKCLSCYLSGSYQQSLENGLKVEEYFKGIMGMMQASIYYLYNSLALLALYPESTGREKKRAIKKVRSSQKKLKKWAHHAPMNYLHKFYLVEAERSRVLGKDGDAAKFYDKAIALAHESKYLNEEALANELAGKFYLAQGREKIAGAYMKEALYLYNCWGAMAKAQHLEKTYARLLLQKPIQEKPAEGIIPTATKPTATSGRFSSIEVQNLTTVIKASLAISSEIKLDKFLSRIMKIIIENAGAQKGILILKRNETLAIEATASVDSDEVAVFKSISIDKVRELSKSIVRYAVRTGETVIISDPAKAGLFTDDSYIIKYRPKSILCTPIHYKNEIAGALYLENNLTTNTFTEDRIEMLNILLPQATISLENALLFDKLNREIAERKRTEEKFKRIFNLSPDLVGTGNMSGYFTKVNSSFKKILGYEDEAFLAKPFIEFVHDEDVETTLAALGEAVGGKREINVRNRYKCKDGSYIWIEWKVQAFEEEDMWYAAGRDISDQKQSEEELLKHRNHLEELVEKRTTILEKTNMELKETQSQLVQSAKLASIGELTTGVTHELNQPLMYIRSNVQLETMNGPEHLDSQSAYETLKTVEEGTDRMMNIIDHLRNFARQTDFSFEHVQLNAALKNSFTLFNEQFRLRAISIHKDFDERLPDIWGDANQLEQVFINMLSNARDALTEREDAILRIKTKFRPTENGAGDVVVSFTDNGRGIPDSIMDKIFDPFFTTKRTGEGTGLGLSISYGIVKNHKGEITVSSAEGEGTSFEITLPILQEGQKDNF